MKYLIAFAAVLGYASAGLIAPYIHANAGDIQAAHIDAAVANQDHARAYAEGNARAAEAVHLHNSEAVRQAAETNRDLHETAYWGSVAASQNYVAAAQSQAAALDGHAAAARAAWAPAAVGYHGYAAAPLAYAAAPLAYGAYGHGYAGHGLGYAGW